MSLVLSIETKIDDFRMTLNNIS